MLTWGCLPGAVADRAIDGSVHRRRSVASGIAAAGREYTGCCRAVREVRPLRWWAESPTAGPGDHRRKVAVRWDPPEVVSVPFPVAAAREVVVADLPAVGGRDLAGEDSRRRDSDRGDRAGRVIGRVRYCPAGWKVWRDARC